METVGDFEYNPKDLIGHGAFAVVFKGRSKQGGLVVAIKSITKKNLSKSHNLLGKEIKILKELTEVHHENIVALLDCKETSHHVFLVMEYCNGGDLADYLSVKGTLSEDTIRLFLRQLAGAMRALNAKGIVHRDLKPQNILLSYAGKAAPQPHYIVLKIADFGFARFLQDGVMAATLCGSPMYMAPEVIMSLQYDAKADLWSLGTIVFQCLTGRAPFQAQTPQALKQFYERNQNLQPKIPAGTSQELHSLLMGLLRRNAKDRIDFETFFSHPFLQRPPPSPPQPVPRASPPPPPAAQPQPQPVPPKPSKVPIEPTRDADEDFVLVPQVAKSPPVIRQASPPRPSSLRLPQEHDNPPQSEPLPVPSQKSAFKQIQESLAKTETKHNPGGDSQSPASSASSPTSPTKALVPRSQPISVCSHDADKLGPDLSSLSPPAVQFSIGTPPGVYTPGGGRRRSASGSSGGTPPQHPWTISPSVHSPLRKPSVSSPHLPNGSLPPIKGSPTKAPSLMELGDTDSYGSGGSRATPIPHSRSPCTVIMPMHTRAVTLPDFTPYTRSQSHNDAVSSPKPVQPRSLRSAFGSAPYFSFGSNGSLQRRVSGEETAMVWGSSPGVEGPLVFVAPDLPEETLLEKEHNDTLAKLHFVLALVDCIGEVAKCRASPLTAALVDSCSRPSSPAPAAAQPVSEAQRRAEQLTLHLRALQLLSSALSLAWEELKVQRLQPSITVKQTIKELNERFRLCLSTCKALNSPGLFQSVGMDPSNTHVVADKLLYSHAIDMCQSAALDELFGNPGDCFRRYQTAQLLLHSLAHQVQHPTDKGLLNKYKDAVEKRLYVLQQQGYIYAYDTT